MAGKNPDLRAFLSDGRLLRLPARWARRRAVLEQVVQSFEPGRRFSEKEVDVVLRAWCADGATDHVTLRRYLVDEGLLSREHGTYWRSGGWLDVLGTGG
jgi:hypothetical protein